MPTPSKNKPSGKKLTLEEYEKLLSDSVKGFGQALSSEKEGMEFCDKVRSDLRHMRRELKIKQIEVAEKLDASQSSVSHFEKDKGDINLMTVWRYAAALGMRPAITFLPTASSYSHTDKLKDVLRALNDLSAEQSVAQAPLLTKPATDEKKRTKEIMIVKDVESSQAEEKNYVLSQGIPIGHFNFAQFAARTNEMVAQRISSEVATLISSLVIAGRE